MERLLTPERTAIVALGKNWLKEPHPSQPEVGTVVFPSIDTVQTAIAAAEIYLLRRELNGLYLPPENGDILMPSTGHTLGRTWPWRENQYPTEAGIMIDNIRNNYSSEEIPNEAIDPEDKSRDTAGNAKEVGNKLRSRGITHAIVVSVRRHFPRAEKLFRTFNPDIEIETAITEDILEERGFSVVKLEPEEMKQEARVEETLNRLLHVDPRGRIPSIITFFSRH